MTLVRACHLATAAVCQYEAVAINSRGRIPTITRLCGHRPPLIPVIVGGLVVHLGTAVVMARRMAQAITED